MPLAGRVSPKLKRRYKPERRLIYGDVNRQLPTSASLKIEAMVGEGGAAGSRTRVRIGIELRFLHVYCFLIFENNQVKQLPNNSLSYIIRISLVEMG